MIHIPAESTTQPTKRERYIVHRHTELRINSDNIHLTRNINFHEDMKYKCENGDHHILTPSEPIINFRYPILAYIETHLDCETCPLTAPSPKGRPNALTPEAGTKRPKTRTSAARTYAA